MLNLINCGIIGICGLIYVYRKESTILLLSIYSKLKYSKYLKSSDDEVKLITLDIHNNKKVYKYDNIDSIFIENKYNSLVLTKNDLTKNSLVLSISIRYNDKDLDITNELSKYFITDINLNKSKIISILEFHNIHYNEQSIINIIDNDVNEYTIELNKEFILFYNSISPIYNVQYL